MSKALHGTTHVFDYVFAVADFVHEERLSRISFDDVHGVIKKVAIIAQTTREIEAGKKWRDYQKKAQEKTFMREAADKTVSAMILWGFLKRPSATETNRKRERWYYVKPELHVLGEEKSQKRFRKARLMIFDRILQSEKDSAFNPDLLVKIRDSEKKTQDALSEYDLPTNGVFVLTPTLVRNYLKVSQIDLTMITYWCQELSLLNVFNPRILDIKLPEEVYLTVWLASVNELSSFYNRVVAGNTEIKSFGDHNCAKILEKIKAVREENNRLVPLAGSHFEVNNNEFVLESIDDPYSSELILIGEKSKFWGFVHEELKEFENLYLFSLKHVSTDMFSETLKKHYQALRTRLKTPYVWISPLRSFCCRTLMIGDEYFDNMLTDFYKAKPEAIEFSKAATGIFRKRVRLFEKPFKLYGHPFRMIRLVDGHE